MKRLLCPAFVFLIFASTVCAATTPVDSGKLTFEFAIYFTPKPKSDPLLELARLLADPSRHLRVPEDTDKPDAITTVDPKWAPLDQYAPPSEESLRYTSVGVEPAEAPLLARAERVLILDFSTPRYGAFVANRAACLLMADLTSETGGRIWDEETRQLYSLERWRADRVDSWQANLPLMSRHVTMHAYANPDLIRIVTLGLRKFGLPDLCIAGLPAQHTRPVGSTINALMQCLAEGQKCEGSRFKLTLASIRHPAARATALENPAENAKGAVVLSLVPVKPEQGDANNELWTIDFPESQLASLTERALWGATELFGGTDKMLGAKSSDAEMLSARGRARQAFFAQEKRFRAGPVFGEHLLVKGPFSENDQTEYMWVEVVKWGPDYVEGILTSDPYYVKRLHSGATVKVKLDDIYDYIFYQKDGTQEGNETSKILERREKP